MIVRASYVDSAGILLLLIWRTRLVRLPNTWKLIRDRRVRLRIAPTLSFRS